MKKTFIVTNLATGVSYPVEGDDGATLDTCWATQKKWFTTGCSVCIQDESGNVKIFRTTNEEESV